MMLKLLVVTHSGQTQYGQQMSVLLLDLPTNSIDLASYPPFICNSPSIACHSTLLLALISRLLPWPSKAVHSQSSQRSARANKLSSLTVDAPPPGCRLQPGPHRSAPSTAWS